MDLGTIIGILVGVGSIIVGMIMEGGHVSGILQLTAALIVFGGTAGATMIGFPLKSFIESLKALRHVIFDQKHQDPQQLITEIVGYAQKARKDGILALESSLPSIKDPFLKKALSTAVDGVEPKAARQAMELELQYEEEAGEKTPKIYEAAGGYAPTIGILGAVLGLIEVMQKLDNIEAVGKGIAVAFVATIYGVASANLFFLPASNKLKLKHRKEMIVKEMMMEGVIGILEGLSPRILEDKLVSFFAGEVKAGGEGGGEGDMRKAA